MLWYLCERRNRLPIRWLREYAGREFRRLVRPLYYDALLRRRSLPGGAYVFTDIELLDPKPLVRLRRIAARLREHGATILNDPARALGRYPLLRRLAEEGINDFDVYRVDEGRRPRRWPAFLRGERDHKGGEAVLLRDASELDAALERGPERDDLIVEFVDVKDDDGMVRKYGACRVGDRVFARHLLFGRGWMVKLKEEGTPAQWAEERRFVDGFTDPERSEVARIFDLAGIQYGRIDYSRLDGRIQVWEINTNPVLIDAPTRAMANRWPLNREVIDRHVDALLHVARRAAGRPAIPLVGVRGIRGGFRRR